jgi:hypothetical protein
MFGTLLGTGSVSVVTVRGCGKGVSTSGWFGGAETALHT